MKNWSNISTANAGLLLCLGLTLGCFHKALAEHRYGQPHKQYFDIDYGDWDENDFGGSVSRSGDSSVGQCQTLRHSEAQFKRWQYNFGVLRNQYFRLKEQWVTHGREENTWYETSQMLGRELVDIYYDIRQTTGIPYQASSRIGTLKAYVENPSYISEINRNNYMYSELQNVSLEVGNLISRGKREQGGCYGYVNSNRGRPAVSTTTGYGHQVPRRRCLRAAQ